MATYGCKDRLIAGELMVQDGYRTLNVETTGIGASKVQEVVVPNYISIENRMSRDCRYDLKAADSHCAGCAHR